MEDLLLRMITQSCQHVFVYLLASFLRLYSSGFVFPSWSLEPGPFATCVGYMKSQRVPRRAKFEGWFERTLE